MKLRMVSYFEVSEDTLQECGIEDYKAEDFKNHLSFYDFMDISDYYGIADVSFVSDDCDVEKCEEYEANLIADALAQQGHALSPAALNKLFLLLTS